jgi:hypothetical protein
LRSEALSGATSGGAFGLGFEGFEEHRVVARDTFVERPRCELVGLLADGRCRVTSGKFSVLEPGEGVAALALEEPPGFGVHEVVGVEPGAAGGSNAPAGAAKPTAEGNAAPGGEGGATDKGADERAGSLLSRLCRPFDGLADGLRAGLSLGFKRGPFRGSGAEERR